jgi:cysteine desulfurase/selenocysteine lyase
LFAVTAVSNVLGTRNPVETLVALAKANGTRILIDAAQSAPHEITDVANLDCDFLTLSGHKMLGPTGIGVLYGKEDLLSAMPPFLGGGGMINSVSTSGFTSAELPAKFEAGTPPIVEAIGLGAAVKYLERIGVENIHAHELQLTLTAHSKLAEIGGVRFLGPEPAKKAGILSFTMQGVHAHDIAQVLDHCGVAVRAGHHCTMPLHTRLQITASTRASFYLYNTQEEIDRLAAGIVEIKRKFRA